MRCFASAASPVHAVLQHEQGIKLPVFTRKPQMSELILFNKPYGVICQFSAHPKHPSLADYVRIPDVYPAGRLDTDSEGLLLLTADGALQHQISHPGCKLPKTYWAQVEGVPDDDALAQLRAGVDLGDLVTQPAQVRRIDPPSLWPRTPPIRVRQSVPDSWLEIIIHEGKNRQVRRMTAKVGHPTLRLVRAAICRWSLGDLPPGELRQLTVSAPPLANGGKPAHHDRAMSRADRPAPPRPGVRARHAGRRR